MRGAFNDVRTCCVADISPEKWGIHRSLDWVLHRFKYSRVPDDARLMHEEPFGPVAPVNTFRDLDEAIERANDTEYGLAAYVFTRRSDGRSISHVKSAPVWLASTRS